MSGKAQFVPFVRTTGLTAAAVAALPPVEQRPYGCALWETLHGRKKHSQTLCVVGGTCRGRTAYSTVLHSLPLCRIILRIYIYIPGII